MKTNWNYSALAEAYLKRPDYTKEAIDSLLDLAKVSEGDPVCDVGAGVAHLTLHLLRWKLNVSAVEPNDEMRALGEKRTESFTNCKWYEGKGEATGMPDASFRLVTFGSSFNVTDRAEALKETYRILKPNGYLACMWNHRSLEDPIQSGIEKIIQNNIPNYDYGSRRQDQTKIIESSGLFTFLQKIEGSVRYEQSVEECVEAWRSHATLERQAKEKFTGIVNEIENFVKNQCGKTVSIPYTTRIWLAQRKS